MDRGEGRDQDTRTTPYTAVACSLFIACPVFLRVDGVCLFWLVCVCSGVQCSISIEYVSTEQTGEGSFIWPCVATVPRFRSRAWRYLFNVFVAISTLMTTLPELGSLRLSLHPRDTHASDDLSPLIGV